MARECVSLVKYLPIRATVDVVIVDPWATRNPVSRTDDSEPLLRDERDRDVLCTVLEREIF